MASRLRLVLSVVLLLAFADAARAYVVVMRDGRALSAIAAPSYAEGVACVGLTGGEELELRRDDVDERATHMANAGGVVDVPFSSLKPVVQPLPQYPESLRGQRVNGVPIVEVIFGEDGKLETLLVLRSVHPDFDVAVTEAIRQWQVMPYLDEGGRPARVRTAIFVHLQLKS